LLSFLAVPPASAQPQQPSLKVTYTINLDPHFKLYGYLTDQVTVNVEGNLTPTAFPTIVTVGFPFSYSNVVNLPPGANFTLQATAFASTSATQMVVNIPSGQDSFNFTVEGTLQGLSSLFFRDIAGVPPISVQSSAPPYSPTVTDILVPKDSSIQIRSVTPANASQLVNFGGNSYLQLSPQALSPTSLTAGVSFVYQSTLSNYYAFLAIGALVGLALASSLVVRKVRGPLRRMWNAPPSRFTRLLTRPLRARRTKSLLVALMLVCLSMIAVSTIFGPPPQPRAYLAATPTTTNEISPYIKQAGWSFLDTANAADGFSRTSGYGTFSAAVIADYQPEIVGSSPFQEGLNYVPNIIVIQQYVSASYISELEAVRPGTIVISNPADLVSVLARDGGRQNALGLTVSEGTYARAAAFVGLLSLIVPFLALAFIASFAIDLVGGGIGGVLELIAYGVMVYLVAEFAFIVSTVMLGTPVALHAAISNKETAEGFLGPFGGGTRPRELSGTLGFIFGVVYNVKGGLSYDKSVVAAVASVFAFLVVDPLNVASSLFESLLSLFSNVGYGVSGPVYESLRSLIGQPIVLFQSYLTSDFVASHGDALFFASIVPFVLYSRAQKGTGTLLLLFGALGCGVGFIRIADMVPMETIASIAPGALLGVALIPVFYAMSKLESMIRR